MPSITLEMTVRNSDPAIRRTVLIDPAGGMGAIHEVICAAFGFSGLQEHSYSAEHPGSPHPLAVLATLLKIPGGRATYHYGNADGDTWAVDIENLGHPHSEMLVPQLIDALGPDVVEGCGGAEAMSAMRRAAVQTQAELPVDADALDLITIFLPGMSPDRAAQRLAYTDPASIAHRVAFATPPKMMEGAGTPDLFPPDEPDPSDYPGMTAADPVGSDEVPEQLPEEDRRGFDAETMAEIHDALSQVTADADPGSAPTLDEEQWEGLDDAAAEAVTDSIRWFLDYVGDGLPLTQAGYLKPRDVQAIAAQIEAEKYWIGKFNREVETLPVMNLRDALTHLKLLRKYRGKVLVTKLGRELLAQPLELARYIIARLPLLYEVTDLPAMLEIFLFWHKGDEDRHLGKPEGYADNYHLLLAMNVLDRTRPVLAPKQPTPAGKRFLSEVLDSRIGR